MRRTIALTTVFVMMLLPAGARATNSQCLGVSGSVARADELLANRYTLTPHPAVRLPSNPTWREDPLHDANWRFQLHTLRFAESLRAAYLGTKKSKYLDRYVAILRDWSRDNTASHHAATAWDRTRPRGARSCTRARTSCSARARGCATRSRCTDGCSRGPTSTCITATTR
jgi:hypothetical protein